MAFEAPNRFSINTRYDGTQMNTQFISDGARGRTSKPHRHSLTAPEDAHKRNESNLWISKVSIISPGRAVVAYDLPHRIHAPRFTDLVEIQRQAGLAFAHKVLDVPYSSIFVFKSMSLEFLSPQEPQHPWPSSGEILVTTQSPSKDKSTVRSAVASVQFLDDQHVLGAGSISSSFVSEDAYTRLRRLAQKKAPNCQCALESVERIEPSHRIQGQVAIDLSDPILNDHTNDHVSAMFLVSSIERSLASEGNFNLFSLSMEFQKYIEIEPSTQFSIVLDCQGHFHGHVWQGRDLNATFSGSAQRESNS